jgi:predicted Kef-type K+ transport protein
MGYRRRTGFLAGLTVAQISEFSLILAALGLRLGQIGEAEVSLNFYRKHSAIRLDIVLGFRLRAYVMQAKFPT